jgi:hypothetical protein
MTTQVRGTSIAIVRPGEDAALREQFRDFRFEEEERDPSLTPESGVFDPHSTFIVVLRERKGRSVVIAGCSLIDGATQSQITPERTPSPRWYFEVSQILIDSRLRSRAFRDKLMCLICQRIARYAFLECTYEDLYCDATWPFYLQLRRIFGSELLLLGDIPLKPPVDDRSFRVPVHMHRDSVRTLIEGFEQKRKKLPSLAHAA